MPQPGLMWISYFTVLCCACYILSRFLNSPIIIRVPFFLILVFPKRKRAKGYYSGTYIAVLLLSFGLQCLEGGEVSDARSLAGLGVGPPGSRSQGVGVWGSLGGLGLGFGV